jgi:6-phosphogluconate dehydrogenase
MVHNGIEYADMQTICEAYWLMHQLLQMPAHEIGQVFRRWGDGPLSSYLIDITADILAREDPDSGAALVDKILDTAEQKGTGKWASQVALDLGVPAPTIAQAVSARTLSALKGERVAAAGVLTGARTPAATGLPAQALIERIGSALLAAKVCAYAQGFALLRAADLQYGWQLPMATIAGVWRAGCIIRARLLEDIRQAHEAEPELSNLLLAPRFATLMVQAQQDLREVVALSALHGVAAPAFMSSLAYYDAYRSARLPANLLQAQRDYFGAAHRPSRPLPHPLAGLNSDPPGRPALAATPSPKCSAAGAHHRVGAPMQVGQQLQTQTGLVVEADHAVAYARQFRHQLFVPAGVEGPHTFLNERVRCMQRKMR